MKVKRMLAAALAGATMCTAAAPIYAAERITGVNYEINDDFEDYTSGVPEGWTAYGVWDGTANGAYTPTPEKCEGKSSDAGVKVTLTSGQYTAGIQKDLSSAITASEYLDFSFDVKAESETSYPVIRLKNASGGECARIAFVNGNIKTSDGATRDETAVIGTYTYTPGEWFNVKVRIDGYNGTYSVWVDGNEAVSQAVYAWDGGKMKSGWSEMAKDMQKQNLLGEATSILLGVYQSGVCCFDNVTAAKYAKETNAGTTVFSTDFSDLKVGYGNIPKGFMIPSRYWGVGGGVVDSEHGTSLALRADDKAGLIYKLDTAATSGIVTYEFDAYKENTTGTSNIPLSIIGYGTDAVNSLRNYWENVWLLQDSQDRLSNNETALNKWMKYKLVVNMDTKEITLYCDGNVVSLTTGTWPKSKIGAISLHANDLTGAAPTDSGNNVYIDNFKCVISHSQKEATEDNIDYADVTALKKGWNVTGVGGKDVGNVSLEKDNAGNSMVKIDNMTDDKNGSKTLLEKKIQPIIDENTIRVEYGIKVEGNISFVNLMTGTRGGNDTWGNLPAGTFDSDGNNNTVFGMGDYLSSWGGFNKICDITLGEWYDITEDVNLVSGDITVKIVNRNTGVKAQQTINMSQIGNIEYHIDNLRYFKFQQTEETQQGAYYIDYFKASQVVPEAEEPSITLIGCDENEYGVFEAVTPAISKIKLDFGTSMSTQSILENVSLVDANGQKVPFMATVDGTCAVLTLTDLLDANQSYTLTVGKDVENISGIALGTDVITTFSTNTEKAYAKGFGVTVDGTDVTSLTQLGTDVWARINGKYINALTDDKGLCIIISSYKNNKLIATDYQQIAFADDMSFADFSYLKKIKAAEGADEVKIFLWNGDKYMYPLVSNISVK